MKEKISNIVITTTIAIFLTFTIAWDYSEIFILKEFLLRFLFGFVFVEGLLLILWPKLVKLEFKSELKKIQKDEYLVYSIIILIPLVIGMIAYYPLVNGGDPYYMWEYMKNGYFNNWHPLPYVMIFYGIPSLISNNIFSVTIFQSIFIMLALLYVCKFLRENFINFKQMILFLVLFTFNPFFIRFSMDVLKDIPYSYCLLIITLQLMLIAKSNGEWLNKKKNKLFFIFVSLGVLTFRHNGIVPFVFTYFYLIVTFSNIRLAFSSEVHLKILICSRDIYKIV